MSAIDGPGVGVSDPLLSIIIPAFNEAGRLPQTVERVLAWLDDNAMAAEIVLVDDGSGDETPAIMASLADADPRVSAVLLPDNRGKGAAVRAGVRAAAGGWIAFFDADLSYDMAYLQQARALLERGGDVVVGARDLGPADSRKSYGLSRRVASIVFNGLVERSLRLGVRDTQCGFKVFRASAARPLFDALRIDGFGFDVELLFLARRWGLNLHKLPVEMQHQAGSSVSIIKHSVRMARDVLGVRRRARRGQYPEVAPQRLATPAGSGR